MVAHPKLRPVDTSTRGVFLAGCAEGPKDIKESVTQASAAAARANIIMRRGKVTVEAITARVDAGLCTGCGACVKVCPYKAIQLDEDKKAVVIDAACAGCGTCGAECAVRRDHDAPLHRRADHSPRSTPSPSTSRRRRSSPSTATGAPTRARTSPGWAGCSTRRRCGSSAPCAPGRVATRFVERAFARGAAMVLISGCHIGDCHYIDANTHTERRYLQAAEAHGAGGARPGAGSSSCG